MNTPYYTAPRRAARAGRLALFTHLLLLLALLLARPGAAAPVPPGPTRPGTATPALAGALRPDGTLRPDARGSFDATGYTMGTAPDGHPVFRPSGAQGTLGAQSR